MTANSKFYVTLSALRKAGACVYGYNRLVRAIQGKEFSDTDEARETHLRFAHKDHISIRSILDSNGIDDALWALRCIEGADKNKDIRMFAIWCARQVEHLITDQRSKDALNVAERYANGEATDDEMATARAAARAAAGAAARAAAGVAARAAAWAAAGVASWDAAWAAARAAQKNRLIEMLESGRF